MKIQFAHEFTRFNGMVDGRLELLGQGGGETFLANIQDAHPDFVAFLVRSTNGELELGNLE